MLKRFFLLLLIVIGWGGSPATQASRWPYYSMEIISCKDAPACRDGVSYGNAQTHWISISDTLKSTVLTTTLVLSGLHCAKGNAVLGIPYSGCVFIRSYGNNSHADPHVSTFVNSDACVTTAPDNFKLKDPSACAVMPNGFDQYSFHGGAAGPGAECMVAGKVTPYGNHIAIETPFGLLTADQVANSRGQFCSAGIPPPADCTINVVNGGVLDHGTQAPNSISERSLDFSIACGGNPTITIVDPDISLDDNHIHANLSYSHQGGNNYLLKSVLTSTNATAGSYSGSTVITVSPY
ncbi:hypothetical protein [uncultured Cedecea sp.]|uniref:hypothetical protein n=1 Tax=uncultured Cedecea sp. TaxID=988762 RepID=UPI00260D89B1|nr:hypothetical protein [uncultured Cedecea sp.]